MISQAVGLGMVIGVSGMYVIHCAWTHTGALAAIFGLN